MNKGNGWTVYKELQMNSEYSKNAKKKKVKCNTTLF